MVHRLHTRRRIVAWACLWLGGKDLKWETLAGSQWVEEKCHARNPLRLERSHTCNSSGRAPGSIWKVSLPPRSRIGQRRML
jgi:hypothetical protein